MMRLGRIVRSVNGRPDRPFPDIDVPGVSTDTRSLRPGDVFFALRGPSFDGHAFVEEAFRRGAAAAVVERELRAPGLQVRVEEVLSALGALAAARRRELPARVVAITGSNGKTTTKDMVAHLLGRDRRVVRAQGSFNNFVGVPLTLLAADEETEFVILEVGTNHPGEIARMAAVARPDAAVITSVGRSHLEGLGSVEGVAVEKAALLDFLAEDGFAVLHDDPRILSRARLPGERRITFGFAAGADLRAEEVEPGLRFRARGVEFRLGLLGDWNALNALAACAVAMKWGVDLPECARRLADFRGPRMRMEWTEREGVTVVNDAYNSNPESAARAVGEFSRLSPAGRKVAVIGDMLELGTAEREQHRALGELLARSAVDVVVGVGTRCRAMLEAVGTGKELHSFGSVEEMGPRVAELIKAGDAVLLKGSRGMGLERLVAWIGKRTG